MLVHQRVYMIYMFILNHRIDSDRPVAISQWFHHASRPTLLNKLAGKAVYKPIYNHDTGNKDGTAMPRRRSFAMVKRKKICRGRGLVPENLT